MLTPLPPPPPPRDLGPRLQRLGAQAAAIVLLGLFGFGVAGLVVDTDDEPTAAPATTSDDLAEPTAAAAESPATDAGATDDGSPDGATPTGSTSSDASPTSPAPSDAATTEAPSTEPTTASPSAAGRQDPATIRIQVLDGVGDGGTAANRVAADLREAGYNVVVVNQASRRYDDTTVFFTDGQRDAAEQVSDEFGYPVVAPKPDNLSSSVELHVVVGTDQA